jgi:hypothetical protein
MPRILSLFLIGLVLGVAGSWLFPGAPAASPASSQPPSNHSSAPAPASAVASAISNWRALRSPDGAPADYATRAAALRSLLLHLPASAFARLLDTFADTERSPDELALRALAFAHWTELDPAAAARWAAANPARHELARDALNAWSARDARAAATWVCSLPDEATALALAAGPLAILAAQDGPAAVALVSARGDAFLKKILPQLLPVLAGRDPAGAVRAYGPLLWDRGRGASGLRPVLSAWLAAEPQAALDWILSQPRAQGISISYTLYSPRPDSAACAALVEAVSTRPDMPERQATLANLLVTWSVVDTSAALAWLDRLPDPQSRVLLLERALTSPHQSQNPARLLPLALALPESDNRGHRISTLLSDWAAKDPSAALRWTTEHSSDPAVNQIAFGVQASALGAIARDEPATAIKEWQTLPAGPLKYAGIVSIAEAWGRSDPGAAILWQSEQAAKIGIPLPPDQSLIYAWARRDELAALRWAETLPEGELRQHGLSALTQHGSARVPNEAAANLYAQLKNPALRVQLVGSHVREWLAKDPAAARAWLDTHDALTPEQSAALLAK